LLNHFLYVLKMDAPHTTHLVWTGFEPPNSF